MQRYERGHRRKGGRSSLDRADERGAGDRRGLAFPQVAERLEALGFAIDVADFDLLVLGDCNPDLALLGDEVEPAFGQVERLLDDARLVVGGSGSITACGAARLGLRTAFVGVVGDDVFGRFMLDSLTDRGVDVSGCVVDPDRPTGLSVILLRPGGGDRAILTMPGTSATLTARDVPSELLSASRHIHVAAYFLQDALRPNLPSLFKEAKAAGVTTSIDPNWDPSGEWDGDLHALLPLTDVFFPNEAEAVRISGRQAAREAAGALAAARPLVVMKSGAEGAMAVRGEEEAHARAPAVNSVDSIGAGDSFDAGFLAGFIAGWDLQRALTLGCAAGALSTRAIGGTSAQPTLEEALEAAGVSG